MKYLIITKTILYQSLIYFANIPVIRNPIFTIMYIIIISIIHTAFRNKLICNFFNWFAMENICIFIYTFNPFFCQ